MVTDTTQMDKASRLDEGPGDSADRNGQVEFSKGSQVIVANAPRVLAYAKSGITTSQDFIGFSFALISDLVEGKISANTAHAICKTADKALKAKEMELRYGEIVGARKVLTLVSA